MTLAAEIREWRKAQRSVLLAKREAVPSEIRHARNEAITGFLDAGFCTLEHACIGLYWPFKAEFDARFFVFHMRKRGARAALPVVVTKQAPLEFREWWPGVDTAPGVFDLPVPQGTAVVRPDALLIPPVGFDAEGFRLGYGGGYFDRTLASLNPQPLKIGVGFEISRIDTIRPQPHDVPMDFIVTERGVHSVTESGLVLIEDLQQVQALVARAYRRITSPA